MRQIVWAACLAAASVLSPSTSAGTLTYNINFSDPNLQGPGLVSVNGFITVGKLGALSVSDITDYELILTSASFPQFTLTPANSQPYLLGTIALEAQAQALLATFAAGQFGDFKIVDPSDTHYLWFYEDGAEVQRELGNVVDLSNVVLAPGSLGGTFGVGSIAAVPEPSSLSLAGFGALAAFGWFKGKQPWNQGRRSPRSTARFGSRKTDAQPS